MWLRSFIGSRDRVLTCLSQYQKRTWFYPEEERAPEFFKYHSVHKVHRSLPKAHGPHLCTHTPPSKPLWFGSLQTAPSLWNDCITDLEFSGQLSRYKSNHIGLHDVHSARDRLRVYFHLNDRHRRLQWGLGSTSPLLTPPLGLSATLCSCLSLTHLALQLKGTQRPSDPPTTSSFPHMMPPLWC